MNKLHNSRYSRFGKYSVFVVVLSVFLLASSAVFADSASKGQGNERGSEISKVAQSLKGVAGRDSNKSS